jgi:DnaJ-class molecular chaperone
MRTCRKCNGTGVISGVVEAGSYTRTCDACQGGLVRRSLETEIKELLSMYNQEAHPIMPALKVKCPECNGSKWRHGECHAGHYSVTCIYCEGTGIVDATFENFSKEIEAVLNKYIKKQDALVS